MIYDVFLVTITNFQGLKVQFHKEITLHNKINNNNATDIEKKMKYEHAKSCQKYEKEKVVSEQLPLIISLRFFTHLLSRFCKCQKYLLPKPDIRMIIKVNCKFNMSVYF